MRVLLLIGLIYACSMPACATKAEDVPLGKFTLQQLADRLPLVPEKQLKALLDRTHVWPYSPCDPWVRRAPPQPGAAAAENALLELIRRGPSAVGFLCRHIFDARPVQYHAKVNWCLRREYDRNPWGHGSPSHVAINEFLHDEGTFEDGSLPGEWTMTVGDLCYLALGQIVNRRFCPVDGEVGTGQFFPAPSRDRFLGGLARKEWGRVDRRELLASLTQDVMSSDRLNRDWAAMRRIALYFPGAAKSVALEKLRLPLVWPQEVPLFVHRWEYRVPNYSDVFSLHWFLRSISDVAGLEIDLQLGRLLRKVASHPHADIENDTLVLDVADRLEQHSKAVRALVRRYLEKRIVSEKKVLWSPGYYRLVVALAAVNKLEADSWYGPPAPRRELSNARKREAPAGIVRSE